MFGDIGKLMGMFGKVKKELPALQEKIAASEFTSQAGVDGKMVRATVSGKLMLIDLEIDPSLETPVAAELAKAAITQAQTQAALAAKEAMAELFGTDLPPGLDGML
jgi:DNA-binding protein YbaB